MQRGESQLASRLKPSLGNMCKWCAPAGLECGRRSDRRLGVLVPCIWSALHGVVHDLEHAGKRLRRRRVRPAICAARHATAWRWLLRTLLRERSMLLRSCSCARSHSLMSSGTGRKSSTPRSAGCAAPAPAARRGRLAVGAPSPSVVRNESTRARSVIATVATPALRASCARKREHAGFVSAHVQAVTQRRKHAP